ncbi:MAG TPA: GNAT family N-acetyltransferase [Allosphingosinicella sp.]|nr:GNAT family N-acetyltransferase [Allosphingosinicella sp.]
MAGKELGPGLETRRLILRTYTADDHDCVHRLASDPETFRFSHHGPLGPEESWAMLLRHVGHWSLRGWGVFGVEEKETKALVGQAGLNDFRRRLGPDFDGVPEITWSFESKVHGRGYATEAAQAALDWIERTHGAARTVCLIHQDNEASLRVADKLGYREFRRCDYRGYPAILFERLAKR